MGDTAKPNQKYEVIVYDMYDYGKKMYVVGFPTFELAKEYARRRTRDSLEEQRPQSTDAKDLHDRWFMFGEDCMVVSDYSGQEELDFFIANPATPEERDWASLQPRLVHE
jgi:hypothetical protein